MAFDSRTPSIPGSISPGWTRHSVVVSQRATQEGRIRLYVVTNPNQVNRNARFDAADVAWISKRFPGLDVVVNGDGEAMHDVDAVFFWRIDFRRLEAVIQANP